MTTDEEPRPFHRGGGREVSISPAMRSFPSAPIVLTETDSVELKASAAIAEIARALTPALESLGPGERMVVRVKVLAAVARELRAAGVPGA